MRLLVKTTVPLVGLALALTACSSSSKDTGSGGGNPSTGSTGSSGGSSNSKPIKVMSIAAFQSASVSYPELKTSIQARVTAINDAGGIDGRKIDMEFCNDKIDPNETTACAQKAVQDKVVAVLGATTPNSAVLAPILDAAKIPIIGSGGGDAGAEATLSPFFPLDGGSAAFVVGLGNLAVKQGGKNIVVVSADIAASRGGAKIAGQGVTAAGGTWTEVVSPLSAVDYSATAATVKDKNPDGVVMVGTQQSASRIILALKRSGYKGVIAAPTSFVDAATLKALGPLSEGLLFCSHGLVPTDTGNATIDEYNKEMQATDPKAERDDLGLNGWMAVDTFAKLVKGHDVATGADVIKLLTSITTPIDQGGVYPPYPGLTTPPKYKDYPRIGTFETLPRIIKNGIMVQQGPFFNPLGTS